MPPARCSFFTAGEKEVRTWLIPKGATAQDAAGGIHTDLAKGFVRAETMSCDDLFRLGSEREVKEQNLMHKSTRITLFRTEIFCTFWPTNEPGNPISISFWRIANSLQGDKLYL